MKKNEVEKFISMVLLAEQVVPLDCVQSDICNNVQRLNYGSDAYKTIYDLYFVCNDYIIDTAEQAFLENFGIGVSTLNNFADELEYNRI